MRSAAGCVLSDTRGSHSPRVTEPPDHPGHRKQRQDTPAPSQQASAFPGARDTRRVSPTRGSLSPRVTEPPNHPGHRKQRHDTPAPSQQASPFPGARDTGSWSLSPRVTEPPDHPGHRKQRQDTPAPSPQASPFPGAVTLGECHPPWVTLAESDGTTRPPRPQEATSRHASATQQASAFPGARDTRRVSPTRGSLSPRVTEPPDHPGHRNQRHDTPAPTPQASAFPGARDTRRVSPTRGSLGECHPPAGHTCQV